MQWVKATDKLPEGKGRENKVVVKFDGNVAFGFVNYDPDDPKLYIEYGNKSFLGKDGIVWLDECCDSFNVHEKINSLAMQKANLLDEVANLKKRLVDAGLETPAIRFDCSRKA